MMYPLKVGLLILALLLGSTSAQAEGKTTGLLLPKAEFLPNMPVLANLHWRIFSSSSGLNAKPVLVAESRMATPSFALPGGDYLVHVSFGLASAIRSVHWDGGTLVLKIPLAAGALHIHCVTQDGRAIAPADVTLAIYVPEQHDPTARLVYDQARVDDILGLPEGNYHIVSTYRDRVSIGTLHSSRSADIATNSISTGDVHVSSGKLSDITLHHRVSKVTMKLVATSHGGALGGALANSTFTILTPGGDVVRELAGAFPSLVLAEGSYIVIARHNGKTYQTTFDVKAGEDRDVDVLAQDLG